VPLLSITTARFCPVFDRFGCGLIGIFGSFCKLMNQANRVLLHVRKGTPLFSISSKEESRNVYYSFQV